MIELRLGSDVVERLIPHRRPFRMVDAVVSFERKPRPVLRAMRVVSSNEPVFEGHFPGLHLWPGVYTIEGLGQTTNLLFVIDGIVREYEKRGGTESDAIEDLKNLERGFRFARGHDAERARAFLSHLAEAPPGARGGMAAAIDVKLTKPVFAGDRIDYSVVLTHTVESLARCEVIAEVDGHVVAKGSMSGTLGIEIGVR